MHLWASFLPDGKLRGRHFSGLEGAQLWLRNSEAAFASWGAVFTWLGALGRFFILIGRMVVVEELRGGIHILGAPFSGSESLVGKLRGRHFSGLEGAWLCLTNSGAALASWGAVFTCLRAQRAAFVGLEGARLWLRNSRAIFASWGAVFRFRVLGWEAQRAAFFRFRGRLVVLDKLRGGTCILGRRFHLFGSPASGIF